MIYQIASSKGIGRPCVFELLEYLFYDALARAAQYDSATFEERLQYREAIVAHYTHIEAWAKQCPENFENRAALVGAEIARIEGRELEAQRLYEQAIRSARENGFVQNEGIANELAAKFYFARGYETCANAYLRNARYCYLRWGALGKVRQLDQRHPHLHEERGPASSGATIGQPLDQFDLATVVKASQAVSSEIVLSRLMETLMVIAVEHAGADRGLLILLRGEEPRIEAEAATGCDKVEVVVREAVVTPSSLPESVLHYVIRTRESVILDDAAAPTLFSTDPYVQQRRPRSVLCLPLVKQAKLVGVLYLENSLTPKAFTPDRLTVLELLASQAAISLDNARVYTELARLNRTLQTLYQCNQALVRATEEYELLHSVCRILVEVGGLRMAWVGYRELNEEKMVRPVTWAGHDAGYLERINITWADNETGRGTTGTAIRTGTSCWTRDNLTDPNLTPWRDEDLRHGYASSISLPLLSHGEAFGALTLHAEETDAFNESTIEQYTDLANNLAYGVIALRTREERKRAENEIRQLNASLEKRVAERTIELGRSEEKFRALFEGTSLAVALHDENGILEANPSWLRLLGYSSLDGVVGKTYAELSAPIQSGGERAEMLARTHIDNTLARGSERFDWIMLRRDGTELPMEVFLTRIQLDDRQLIQVVCNDITQRKQAEAELLRTLDREKELGQLRSNFVSMVSHEFRTPLGIIQSSAEILEDYLEQLEPVEREDHLQSIRKNTRRMAGMMEEVLLIGSLDAGKMEFKPALLDLRTFVRRLVDEVLSATDRSMSDRIY